MAVNLEKNKSFRRKLADKCILTLYPYSCEDVTTSCDWIVKMFHVYKAILFFDSNCPLPRLISPYLELLQEVVQRDKQTEEHVIKLWLSYFKQQNDDLKFFISKLFFLSGIFNEEISAELLRFARETKSSNYRYWLVMDISKFTFRLQKGFYPEYYQDRKELLKAIAEENCQLREIDNSLNIPEAKRIKVCVVAYLMDDSLFNSMQRVTAMIANAMGERADEVMVISLESFSTNYCDKRVINTLCATKHAKKNRKAIEKMFHNVTVEYVSTGNYIDRMNSALSIIHNYQPTAIVDISDEYSPMSYYYQKICPVYYIPLRSNASSSFYTYVLGNLWIYEEGNKRYHSVEPSKVKEWMFPEYVPPNNFTYSKEKLGISKDSFIIVSIGNNTLFTESFCEKMSRVLENNEKIVWLLVGSMLSQHICNKHSSLIKSNRIIEHGFEENLSALCAICDVLVRPDMTGGSGSTAIACQNGIPIVMSSAFCDPLRWLGRNYSQLHSEDEMISEIFRLYNDKEYYHERSEQCLKLVSVATDEELWWDKLYQIITETTGGD